MFQHYINGTWVGSDEASQNINPSDTNDVIGAFARATAVDVDDAVAAAKEALKTWSHSGPMQRHDLLRRIGAAIFADVDRLGFELSREQGKTLAEGKGEATRAGQLFEFYAGETLRMEGIKIASIRPGVEIEVTREPVGVVGIIAPWNYPLAIPAWKIAPALAYGNTVVFKPADLVPHSAFLLSKIIADAGVPKGVFNLVLGQGRVVGEAILNHDDVNAISFTGSQAVGLHVAQCATKAFPLKKIQLELGGKSPLVVLDDADLDIAVGIAVNGAFFGTGQRCTASTRIVVTQGIHDRFVAAMKIATQALTVGNALDESTMIGPVVDDKQLAQDLAYIQIGQKAGAKLITGGDVLNRETPGFYLSPAIFTEVQNDMRIAREEIFGPVASVIRVKDYDAALEVANDSDFGLSSGICTTSLKYASDFKRKSASGMVTVNLPTAGVDFHVPFGGRKGSSYGAREQGRAAVDFYTVTKTTYIQP
ncbi:MAG: aldehyde dehydrogenase family protein [Rhodobacteraceae bacterium]|nr:aldehyde dehydrogenase family protein [Paracoccaceae bacterium]